VVELYGQTRSAREVAALTGDLAAFGGVRLMTLADGNARGVRLLEFRTAAGLRFTVMVDRAMDIGELEHRGRPIGWHSPTGFRSPALNAPDGEDGLGLMRSFTGFLVTCGLDHILGDEVVDAENYAYPRRARVPQPLHGRLPMEPAQLTGYGERWDGDRCVLWAEGRVRQAAGFAENLELIRRIEVDLDGTEISITDKVRNRGFRATPHMLLYHFNVGHPVLDEGARYLAPIRDAIWASHAGAYEAQGVGYDRPSAPADDFTEQVWEYDMAEGAEGRVPVALVNDRIGMGVEIETAKAELPCAYAWQNLQAGSYAFGIEPATHHVLGNSFARERGEMIWLGALEERDYRVAVRVLDGAEAIGASEARIRAAGPQPQEPYPPLSGDFPPLKGPGRRARHIEGEED